jgi:hypothetical protein
MATENPKVSGYVPQEIFDRLLDFKEERSLKSVSLALTVVLSEYFHVDQKVDHQSSLLSGNDFVSREQFEGLENRISELPSSLLNELDRIVDEKIGRFQHELLYGSLKLVEAEVVEVNGELLNEPEPLSSLLPIESQTVNAKSELPSELPIQPQEDGSHLQLDLIESALVNKNLEIDSQSSQSISEQSNLILSESPIPIQTKLLAKRLNLRSEKISANKRYMPERKFYDWLQETDPDKISWQPALGNLKDRVKGWIPAKDTPSELLSRLEEWLLSNPE